MPKKSPNIDSKLDLLIEGHDTLDKKIDTKEELHIIRNELNE